jgi:glycerate 2-kinase
MENDSPRRQADTIFYAALRAVDPCGLVKERADYLSSLYYEEHCQRIILISFGKAAFPMTKALADAVPHLLSEGVLITKDGHLLSHILPPRIAVHEAAHPSPDIRGVRATEEALRLLRKADRETLVVCLVSGGGSALLVSPQEGISLQDKQEITQRLLQAGANIGELNTVRKHLSRVKGGRLMEMAYPAKVVSLILSDVIGDPLDVIASGPTAPDGTTFCDALAVIERYDLKKRVPEQGLDLLMRGVRGEISETPKAGNPIFDHCRNIIIGSNRMALGIAEAEAAKRGYQPAILSTALQGEARDVGRDLARHALDVYGESLRRGRGKQCLIAGGETTVTVTGSGLGGRNTELALAFAQEIGGKQGITLLSAGTDGTDGPTDAAGAIVDGHTLLRAEAAGLNSRAYLENNDSYHLLEATGDLFMTGPTGTNVMDLQIILIDPFGT